MTPNDDADLPDGTTSGLLVSTIGNVAVILANDTAPVTLPNLAAGVVHKIRARRIMASNTAAITIITLYGSR